MLRSKLLLPVAALLLSATILTPASAADSYGSDNSYKTSRTTTSTSTASNASQYDDVTPSSGAGYYDWNPFTNNQGVYISGQAGWSSPTDDDLEDDGSYAVALGYQFTPLTRVELEAGYRNNDIDGAPGDADTWTWMVNAFWDFKNDTRFTPYIGGGIGWAYQNIDSAGVDDSDNAFVYQVGGGASYNLNQNWALTADYRWVDTGDFDYGAGGDEDYSAHEVRAGVRYTF